MNQKSESIAFDEARAEIEKSYNIMLNRYKKMEQQKLNTYTELQNDNGEAEPKIIFFVDEAITLQMLQPPMDIEDETKKLLYSQVASIARLGRSAGVEIMFSTSQPDTVNLLEEIKANLTTRI